MCETEKNPVEELLVKPSVLVTVNEMMNRLENYGLSEKDIMILVQRRTKPKVPLKHIQATLQGAIELEKTLIYER